MSFICKRNSLKKLVEQEKQPTFDDFVKQYSSIAVDKCEDALLSIDKTLNVLQLIKTDLGQDKALSCEKLRGLDSEHRIALLESCFILSKENEDEDLKKAVFIDKLLQIQALFDKELQNSKNSKISGTIQEINYQIYWAISPGDRISTDKPYYSLTHLRTELQKIISKINIPELGSVKEKLTEALQTLNAPELKPELKEGSLAPAPKSDDDANANAKKNLAQKNGD